MFDLLYRLRGVSGFTGLSWRCKDSIAMGASRGRVSLRHRRKRRMGRYCPLSVTHRELG